MKFLLLAPCLAALVACSSTESADPKRATPSPTPTPANSWCGAEMGAGIRDYGDLAKSIEKTTATAEEIVVRAGELQARAESISAQYAAEGNPDAAKDLRKLAEAVGQLKVSVSARGDGYRFDEEVSIRTDTMQTVAFTAGLSNCSLLASP